MVAMTLPPPYFLGTWGAWTFEVLLLSSLVFSFGEEIGIAGGLRIESEFTATLVGASVTEELSDEETPVFV